MPYSYMLGLPTRLAIDNDYKMLAPCLNKWHKLISDDMFALRQFVDEYNQKNKQATSLSAGELAAVIFINDLSRLMLSNYVTQFCPDFFIEAATKTMLGDNNYFYHDSFLDKYLHLADDELLAEKLILWLCNENSAFSKYLFIFNDFPLRVNSDYLSEIQTLSEHAKTTPPLMGETLINTLRAPARACPDSITCQLAYIKKYWGAYLGAALELILGVEDILAEENKPRFAGPGPAQVINVNAASDEEPEAFSPDKDWMPAVIIIAKSTYIWLNQLSKKYDHHIQYLHQIPDAELEFLATCGFTGLWLIGLWERCPASARIKHLCGNPEAISSAYSLHSYQIADALGGEKAAADLAKRAKKYGIHLACDMVPNHMGLNSQWLNDHPEWFVQAEVPPFPAYTFTGENLSTRADVLIQIEDHYYDQSDAAVVFKYQKISEQKSRYIYHGNDGTSFPWNDTAQLNYLLPQVRENVIQEIIRIAHQFPIIRFDAAMTLAKKHYQRLWYPLPGTGGDIPSRSNSAMNAPDFNDCFPQEFWRELVDRVAAEAPDTLLLAEAFWMMEGYFVRSLGMHRVYNSAFMNMLKDEENAKYRQSIKNVIEFQPEILKRFVNFMNNPDEEPAIIQFGQDDKYFGVCLMMITLPGLPMFGHGQIEGLYERYGMEYHSAKWEEKANEFLFEQHQKLIFPLMKKRHLFAEVANFRLFDFSCDGQVDEDVFAYTNGDAHQKALIIHHNKFKETHGHVCTTYQKSASAWETVSLGAALGLMNKQNAYVIYTDYVSNLQYIRNCAELHNVGLYQELAAYQHAAYLDWQEVEDNKACEYQLLAEYLQGGGVKNMEASKEKIKLKAFLDAFSAIFNPDYFDQMIGYWQHQQLAAWHTEKPLLETKLNNLLTELSLIVGGTNQAAAIAAHITLDINYWMKGFADEIIVTQHGDFKKATDFYQQLLSIFTYYGRILFAWYILRRCGELVVTNTPENVCTKWFDDIYIAEIIKENFKDYQLSSDLNQNINLLKVAIEQQNWWHSLADESLYAASKKFFDNEHICTLLKVNTWNDRRWLHKESFDDFIALLYLSNFTTIYARHDISKTIRRNRIITLYRKVLLLSRAGKKAGFDIDKMLHLLQELA